MIRTSEKSHKELKKERARGKRSGTRGNGGVVGGRGGREEGKNVRLYMAKASDESFTRNGIMRLAGSAVGTLNTPRA